MKNILVIAKKELLDTFRDRRSLIRMVLVPLLVFPILMGVITKIQASAEKKDREKVLRIGYHEHTTPNSLISFLENNADMKLIPMKESTADMQAFLQNDSLDLVLEFSSDFLERIESKETGSISIFFRYNATGLRDRLLSSVDEWKKQEVSRRLLELDVNQAVVAPVEVNEHNISSMQETIGKLAGGFIPYIFILFCFTGCMYPAIDLFTGEKERGTLETILTTPVSRLEILFGKVIVIVLLGIGSALLSVAGLFVALQTIREIPQEFLKLIFSFLDIKFVSMLFLMLVPISVFFAGVMVPLTIQAKSFKEAQSTLTPLTFVVILPALIGMMPIFELNTLTSLIPIVNVALATKEIIAGTIQPFHYILVVSSLMIIAFASIAFCVKQFEKEGNILR